MVMSTELVLGIFGGIITVTVALIGIIPKMKELSKKKKESLLVEGEKLSLEKHPIFLEFKMLEYFFLNDFKLPDAGRSLLVKDIMVRKLRVGNNILLRYAKNIQNCSSICPDTKQCTEINEILFNLFTEMIESIYRPWYKEGGKSYDGREYDKKSIITLDTYFEKFKEWNYNRIELAHTATTELPKSVMNDSCYNMMWDMLSIYSYIFTQMKYDAVATINRLDGEMTGKVFLGIKIEDD